MKKRSKNCGNCKFFIKWKNDQISAGLCGKKDQRTETDSGHNCEMWKAKRYNRI